MEKQQRELHAELKGKAGPSPGSLEEKAIWTNYKLLQMMDRLSLYFCMARVGPRSLGPAPLDYHERYTDLSLRPLDDHTVILSPFPFRKSPLRVSVKARTTPEQAYNSEEHFRAALAQARTISLSFDLQSGSR